MSDSREVRVRERNAATICLFCRDGLEGEEAASCSSCGAVYHADCLNDELNGLCATISCPKEAPKKRLRRAGGLRARLRRRRRRRLLQRPVPSRHARFSAGVSAAVALGVGLLLAEGTISYLVAFAIALLVGVLAYGHDNARDDLERLVSRGQTQPAEGEGEG